jgi:hypothetical protein
MLMGAFWQTGQYHALTPSMPSVSASERESSLKKLFEQRKVTIHLTGCQAFREPNLSSITPTDRCSPFRSACAAIKASSAVHRPNQLQDSFAHAPHGPDGGASSKHHDREIGRMRRRDYVQEMEHGASQEAKLSCLGIVKRDFTLKIVCLLSAAKVCLGCAWPPYSLL